MIKEERLAVLSILDEVCVQLALDGSVSAIVMDKLGEAVAILEREDEDERDPLASRDEYYYAYDDEADIYPSENY